VRAMAEQAIEWAKGRAYRQIGVFEVTSGLLPCSGRARAARLSPSGKTLGFWITGAKESDRDCVRLKAQWQEEMEEAGPGDESKHRVIPPSRSGDRVVLADPC